MNYQNIIAVALCLSFMSCGNAQDQKSSDNEMENKNYPISKSEEEWKKELSEEEYRILRQAGTERAFTGKYYNHHDDGTYTCAACGTALFASGTKFESGSGWPSFYDVISKANVDLIVDRSIGMIRTEVRCGKCGGHLGHVFDDGPNPTGQRYCINSAALDFKKE